MKTPNTSFFLKSIKDVLAFVFIVFAISSCSYKRYSTVKEYRQYIETKANGLLISKKYEHLDLVVKHIPAGMRVLQDIDKGETEFSASSMFKEYSQSIMFTVSLIPSQFCPVRDLNYYGLRSDDEYKERQNYLDFNMAQFFLLKGGEKSLSPQICHFEHDYGVSGRLTFLVVFAAENSSDIELMDGSKDIEFIFDDPFFDTNTNEFHFSSASLLAIPKL